MHCQQGCSLLDETPDLPVVLRPSARRKYARKYKNV